MLIQNGIVFTQGRLRKGVSVPHGGRRDLRSRRAFPPVRAKKCSMQALLTCCPALWTFTFTDIKRTTAWRARRRCAP